MNTNPTPNIRPEFNHEILAIAIGTYTNPGSFSGKIGGIYEMVEVVIKKVESRYEKDIKDGWGKAIPSLESASFDARYEKTEQFYPRKSNVITEHYKHLLENARHLKKQLSDLKRHDKNWGTAPTLKEAISFYLKKDSYSHAELTAAVPIFFALQYHAWTLYCYLTGISPLTNKKARTERASGGGKASNEGRAEFIEDIRKIFSTIEIKEKFKSIETLFESQKEKIASILDEHKQRKSSSGGKVPYKLPKFENMPERIKQWAEENDGFKKEIDRLVQKK